MKKVLLVEDDKWMADNFSRYLKKQGFDCRIATDSQLAMDAVDDIKPNVIVLDVLLDGNTAFTFLHELRTHEDTTGIPIIICSNIASDLNAENLEVYGVNRVLDKTTMQPDDLTAAIRGVI